MDDLDLNCLAQIQCDIRELQRQGIDPYPRATQWMLTALSRDDLLPKFLPDALKNRDSRAQYWLVRQFLPTTAFYALAGAISKELHQCHTNEK